MVKSSKPDYVLFPLAVSSPAGSHPEIIQILPTISPLLRMQKGTVTLKVPRVLGALCQILGRDQICSLYYIRVSLINVGVVDGN